MTGKSTFQGADLLDNRQGRQKHEFEELSKTIISCAISVHRALGPGFLESIYEQALILELQANGIGYEHQKDVEISYRGIKIGTHRLDLLVADTIIVELKAVKDMADVHPAQLRSYLKATTLKTGLLINFSKPTLEVKRVVN